jgi:hypothetical protein
MNTAARSRRRAINGIVVGELIRAHEARDEYREAELVVARADRARPDLGPLGRALPSRREAARRARRREEPAVLGLWSTWCRPVARPRRSSVARIGEPLLEEVGRNRR